jgi:hypothetical protein
MHVNNFRAFFRVTGVTAKNLDRKPPGASSVTATAACRCYTAALSFLDRRLLP